MSYADSENGEQLPFMLKAAALLRCCDGEGWPRFWIKPGNGNVWFTPAPVINTDAMILADEKRKEASAEKVKNKKPGNPEKATLEDVKNILSRSGPMEKKDLVNAVMQLKGDGKKSAQNKLKSAHDGGLITVDDNDNWSACP